MSMSVNRSDWVCRIWSLSGLQWQSVMLCHSVYSMVFVFECRTGSQIV